MVHDDLRSRKLNCSWKTIGGHNATHPSLVELFLKRTGSKIFSPYTSHWFKHSNSTVRGYIIPLLKAKPLFSLLSWRNCIYPLSTPKCTRELCLMKVSLAHLRRQYISSQIAIIIGSGCEFNITHNQSVAPAVTTLLSNGRN